MPAEFRDLLVKLLLHAHLENNGDAGLRHGNRSRERVAALSQIREGEIYPVSVDGVDLIVLRHEGGVAAYLDACPHEGAQLSTS